jgi:hypothetical protein
MEFGLEILKCLGIGEKKIINLFKPFFRNNIKYL